MTGDTSNHSCELNAPHKPACIGVQGAMEKALCSGNEVARHCGVRRSTVAAACFVSLCKHASCLLVGSFLSARCVVECMLAHSVSPLIFFSLAAYRHGESVERSTGAASSRLPSGEYAAGSESRTIARAGSGDRERWQTAAAETAGMDEQRRKQIQNMAKTSVGE